MSTSETVQPDTAAEGKSLPAGALRMPAVKRALPASPETVGQTSYINRVDITIGYVAPVDLDFKVGARVQNAYKIIN